jgi:filamentous hemagglutinin family protein
MNHCYRLVWSTLLNRLDTGARDRARRGRQAGAARAWLRPARACWASAWAGPTGGTVSAGSGSISQSGKTTTVTQASQNLAINWASFSVASGETVNFVQPNRQAIVLNRVTGEASVIDGALQANGQVWLLNAQGVLFGRNASVNVGGLVVSTLGMNDADFMAGKTRFATDGGAGLVETRAA